MFGYIVPDKPELKIKEYELFKAYYCGLCKSIAKHYGQIPRAFLSYDCVFLGLLLSSIIYPSSQYSIEGCITKPMRKMPVIADNTILEYASGINILLAYYKLKDDINDKSYVKYAPLKAVLYASYKKAQKKLPHLDSIIATYLSLLNQLELELCSSIDEAAEPFANLMSHIVSGCEVIDEESNQLLKRLGYNIGKWIYTLDAVDDFNDDIKKHNYNPLCQMLFQKNEPVRNGISMPDSVEFILNYSLKQVYEAYEALNIVNNKTIIDNILYGGLTKKTKQILKKELLYEKPI